MKDLNNEFDFSYSFTVILINKYGRWQKGAFKSLEQASKQACQEVRFDETAKAEIHTASGNLIATAQNPDYLRKENAAKRLFI